jgi:Cu2+-exporting ATPase
MSCCTGDLAVDRVAESDRMRQFHRLEEIQRSGRTIDAGRVQYVLSVPGVHCGQCIVNLEDALNHLPGVSAARVNLTLRRVSFTLDSRERSAEEAVAAITGLGYTPYTLDEEAGDGRDQETKVLLRALAVAGFAASNIMLLSVSVWTGADGATRNLFHLISALIAIPAVAYAGQPFFRSAYKALSKGRTNMDVPISIGVTIALLMSLFESLRGGEHAYFDAAVTLLFFLLIGRTLDHMMRASARQGVARLARLAAKGGLVVGEAGTLTYVPVDEIQPGMILRIAPGERVPVDGRVVSGSSEVDRSLVTGESKPVTASPGQTLESGAMNLSGPLDVEALKSASHSFIADVMKMMEAAERGRGLYVRIADRIARLYAPVVHIMAFASFLGWMFLTHGDWHQSLMIAVAVLIITCPCALGLAVPVAHVISAVQLFRAGILLKDGAALERLAEATHVAFDKTGTLTTGTPQVVTCDIPPDLQPLAKALAINSSHPAAQSLARFLDVAPLPGVTDIHEIPGFGVEGRAGDVLVRLGRPQWVLELATAATLEQFQGRLAFARDGRPAYGTQLRETVRADAARTVASLAAAGLPCEILSGDSAAAVAKVAKATGISATEADLKPADKLDHIAEQKAAGHRVFMVGDGLNDAPALTAAHVSMAPASASDVGRMAADFVFTRDSLIAVHQAHEVALKAARIVRQNFALAIIYNVFAVPLAVAGYVSPLLAAAAMSSSSIIVVANSLRLYLPIAGIKAAPAALQAEKASPARLTKAPA